MHIFLPKNSKNSQKIELFDEKIYYTAENLFLFFGGSFSLYWRMTNENPKK